MNANELLTLLIQALFILLGILTTIDYIRQRNPVRRDIALLFSLFSALYIIPLFVRFIGQQTAGWVSIVTAGVFILEPYILLRLVRYLRPVPARVMRAAVISMVVCFISVFLASIVPLIFTIVLVAYFVVFNSYAMIRFVQGARKTTGVVRQRLKFAAAAAGLRALILLLAAVAALIRPLQSLVALLIQLAAISCAVSFYLAFATPRWLRRSWQLAELNDYLVKIANTPVSERLEIAENMLELCQVANRSVAGMVTGIVQKSESSQQWAVNYKVGQLEATSLDGVDILDRSWQDRTPRVIYTSAKISESERRLLETVSANCLMIVPVVVQQEIWALLLVFQEFGSLFVEDDLNLLTLLAQQNTIFLENGNLVRQMRTSAEKLAQNLQFTESLYDISRQLLLARDYTQILKDLFDCTRKYGTDTVALFSVDVDDSGKPFYLTNIGRIGVEGGAGSQIGVRYLLSDIPVFKYLLDAPDEIMYVEDTFTDERYQLTREVVERVKLRAIVQMPLSIEGKWIGVLNINWSEEHRFDPIEKQFFNALYPLVTTVVERERLRLSEQQAHEKLAERETHYRLLADNISDMITRSAPDGTVTYASPSSLSLLGYAPESLVGKTSDTLVHPDDLGLLLPTDSQISANGNGNGNGNGASSLIYRVRHHDGSYVWVETTSRSIVNEAGKQEVIAVTRDITKRKEAEQAIQQLNTELGQRASQLAIANRELEAFSYSVSHDLRAPLRALDGFSQAIEEDYSDRLDAQALKYLARIRAGSQRMGQLIDDLLELSRITRSDIRQQPVDLSTMASKIAAELCEQYPERRVEFQIENGRLAVTGDSKLLHVVLTNLLSNAWKYTGKQAQPRVEFGTTEYKNRRAYFVRDNGAGFDMAYVDKLFGVFQRLHTAAEFPGNGVGLATVQRIIHRHGGHIWAESVVGQGATFYFSL